jgi:acyl-[acyl-carrier-protein]-phospholipid O-acyltransferase/long-chain-fatty-acid--[acyl-carrier-protein] ligase
MNRRATGLKRDVICAFGEPMSIRSTAAEVKQAVTELSYASWAEYASQLDPIPTAWLKTAKSQPRNTAVADAKGDSLSNLKFITAVWLFTRRMKKHRKEQNIGLLIPTSSGAAIANMAALCAGKTVVNINFTTAVPAVQASLDKAKVATVYSSRRFVKKLTAKGVDAEGLIAGRQVIYLEDIAEQIGKAERLVTLALSALLPTSLLHFLMVNKRHEGIDATAAILFSSGSTGTPKGVCLSHRNFMANLRQIADVLNTQDEDVYCSILPSFHAFGLTVGVFMPLIEGIPTVCHPDPTDALNIAKGIARYKATILAGTNTFFRLYVRNRKVHPLMLQSLRVVVAGAEKVTDDVRNDFLAKFSLELLEGYGLTETCPVMSVNLPDHIDTRYWNTQLGHKHGTVGMALPGSAFRIVDPESLTPLPLGEDGLILAAGPQIMQGYLDEPEMTAEVIREIDGQHWYLTGDIGHLDSDGFLSITDRLSRFAKIGGEMVSMGATESAIRPFVDHETNNIVAVNLPCSKKGEQVVLLIDGKVDIELLRKGLIDSDLAPIMVPSKIFSVSEVPILGSGKIDFKGASTLATQCLAEN